MNSYQREQLQTLSQVRSYLRAQPLSEKNLLRRLAGDYLGFRQTADLFLDTHFGGICNATCYRSRRSACCSREGIITFFADVVINQLFSTDAEIDALALALGTENKGFKCVYLGRDGCLWRVKPIVCQMFLCEPAKAQAFGKDPQAESAWLDLERQRKQFTWPDRPVLFDMVENHFLAAGCSSPLMYLHNSPGLLRIKRQAGM